MCARLSETNAKIVKPKGTNQRDLTLDRDVTAANTKIAFYPLEKLPGADQKSTVPVDRLQELQDCQLAARQLQELKQEFIDARRP